MATKEEAIVELYNRGELTDTQKTAVEELAHRGVLTIPGFTGGRIPRSPEREQMMKETAQYIGPIGSFVYGLGEGMRTVGRGVGLVDPADETRQQITGAIRGEHPIATGAGEFAGEALPFVAPGGAISKVASFPIRAAMATSLGATEGGVISRGKEMDPLTGAGVGGSLALSAEILFPVMGKYGRRLYQKAFNKAPEGAMLDSSGMPTDELKEALKAEGMMFEDLVDDAKEMIMSQAEGVDPGQVARKARFTQEGIPASKGEITQKFDQQATEQRLLGSAEDQYAEPFRQFKARQSEKIGTRMRESFGPELLEEETGNLVQGALEGKYKLMSTEKRELYKAAGLAAKESGNIPIFSDRLKDSIDFETLEDLEIVSPSSIESLRKILSKYGVTEPTEEMIAKGIEPTNLNIENFERFRKTLNQIISGDATGAASVAIKPIKDALDTELDELAGAMADSGISEKITGPLKAARKRHQQILKEFNPQRITGKLIKKTKSDEFMTDASKIYSHNIAGRSNSVENVRKLMTSLGQAGEQGKEAINAIQTSTMMDLINSSFGTKSRKIQGVPQFNPVAFKNRLSNIGMNKIEAIFKDKPEIINRLKNFDKIASDMIPSEKAVPKGSADIILDLANKIGLATISAGSKIPGMNLLMGSLQKASEPIKTGIATRAAMRGEPEKRITKLLQETYPGIAEALGIAGAVEIMEERSTENVNQ